MRPRALALLLAATAAAGELQSTETVVVRAAQSVRPAVVTVITPETNDVDQTGVVIAPGGGILTVRSTLLTKEGKLPAAVDVRFPGSAATVSAKLLASDEPTDTALLVAEAAKGQPVAFADPREIDLGLWVLLVGNTFGEGREGTPTVSLGILSEMTRGADGIEALAASALVNPGSVGAPIVDLAGHLVGIAAPRITDAGGQTVVIPWDRVRAAYRAQGGNAARLVDRAPLPRNLLSPVPDALAVVISGAAAQGARALVGVRSATLPDDTLPPKDPTARQIPKSPPVPGRLPAYDRSSGVVLSADGWIVCPLRVTGWPGVARPLTVDLPDGRALPATLVGSDERLRIALLRVEARGLATLDAAPAVRQGQFAVALGWPHPGGSGSAPQVTFGIVARLGALGHLHPAVRAVQTDAGVAGGNRGGPLVDLDGRLIGVLLDVDDTEDAGYMMRMRARYSGNSGLGFAIPPAVLAEVVPLLQAGRQLKTPMLGVILGAGESGVTIQQVTEKNSAGEPTTAAAAGLKAGDLLLSLGGREIRRIEDVRAALVVLFAGDPCEIVFSRGGQRQSVKVTLAGQ